MTPQWLRAQQREDCGDEEAGDPKGRSVQALSLQEDHGACGVDAGRARRSCDPSGWPENPSVHSATARKWVMFE